METRQDQGHSTELPGLTPYIRFDIRAVRLSTEISLREYLVQLSTDPRSNDEPNCRRTANQSAVVLADLRELRQHLREVMETARARRARRWFTGLAMSSSVSLLRGALKIWTEYDGGTLPTYGAQDRSTPFFHQHGRGITWILTIAACLYVLKNELLLRVAKNTSRSLKNLSSRIEDGDEDVTKEDMDLITGWRWKILLS